MEGKIFLQDGFSGGVSDGSKSGYEDGYQDGIGIDVRKDRDRVSSLRKLKLDSGATVTDLIKWFQEYSGTTYSYGDSGKIYKRTSGGTWSNPKTVSDSHGNGLEIFSDEIFYAGDKMLGKSSGLASGSPTFEDDYFVGEIYEADDGFNNSAASNTYTLTTAVNEGATHKFTFTADYVKYSGLVFNVAAKGTGAWTIVLHDASNVVKGTVTITNATMPTSGYTEFQFDQITELTVGQAYHVHIFSSVADGTVSTVTSSDISTIRYAMLQYVKTQDIDQSSEPTPSTAYTARNATSLSLGASLSEAQQISFVPNNYMLTGISVLVNETPTQDVTVAVHDDSNTLLASATITSANIKSFKSWLRFEFTTPITLKPGASYHFHIYAASASGSILGSSSTFSTAYYRTHFPILLNDENWHAMQEFTNLLCVANGRFLLTIDDAEVIDVQRLVFPVGESIRCFEVIGDYLAIATWRGTSIGDYGQGKLYFWNGTGTEVTSFVKVDGQINAMRNDGFNRLYIINGTEGRISSYDGDITPMRRIKGIGENKTVEVYPQALEVWEGLLRFGISDGTSTTVNRVVYSYGKKDKDYPRALTKDYPISTGLYGSTVQIGAIIGVNATKFLVSWKSGSDYGVDIIDTLEDQLSTTLEGLRFDGGGQNANLLKIGKSVSFRFAPLLAAQSFKFYYRLNNTGSFTQLDNATIDTDAQVYVSFPLHGLGKWFEIEFKCELIYDNSGDQTESPELLSISMLYDVVTSHQLKPVVIGG